MPRYDMRCTACGHTVEVDCPMSESSKQICWKQISQSKLCQEPLEILIATTVMKVDGRHQTKAIMGDGTKMAGHFGTSEKRRKLGWM